jgi:hypothetical protein
MNGLDLIKILEVLQNGRMDVSHQPCTGTHFFS